VKIENRFDDPIVEEMRAAGSAFAAKHGNDLHLIAEALRQKEAEYGHKVVDRNMEPVRQTATG
jgi:hypothetical protein